MTAAEMVLTDGKMREKQKIHRKWSFTGGRVSPFQIAFHAFLTVCVIFLLILILFRRQKAEETALGNRISAVFRLAPEPELCRQLELRDPAAALLPESPAGYLALRPHRGQELFITRPEMKEKIMPPPALHPFVRLPEGKMNYSIIPENSFPEKTGISMPLRGQLFSEKGDFLAELPLPQGEVTAEAGECVLQISGVGALRKILFVHSCGNALRDRAAWNFLESRHDPDGLYVVCWPENKKVKIQP